jgi:hypothetical protein
MSSCILIKIVHKNLRIITSTIREHYVRRGFGHTSLVKNDPIMVSVLLFFLFIFQTDIVIMHKRVLRNETSERIGGGGFVIIDDVLV